MQALSLNFRDPFFWSYRGLIRSCGLPVRCFQNTPFRPFITTWRTTTANEQIIIPTMGTGYDFEIDWGDGTSGSYVGTTPNPTHTYASAGDHTISIRGDFPRFYMANDATYKNKLRSVNQWGDVAWSSMNTAFFGCQNLVILASDTPDLSTVTDMQKMFMAATNLTGNFSGWNTSNVTDMRNMFHSATAFNQPLNSWDTSNVTNMDGMFQQTWNFNQPLNSWNTSKVASMNSKFAYAYDFNQPLNNWDTSNVTNMDAMFANATVFNQDISAWTVTGVVTASNMFVNTALSTYNYNAILDSRSKQAVKT